MPAPVRVLLVDDDEDDFVLTRDLLAELGPGLFALDWASDFDEALAAIVGCEHDVYLLDYHLGARSGLDLLRDAISVGCSRPIILLTGQGGRSVDLESMSAGAADFLPKGGLDPAALERSIRFALERKRGEDALKAMRDGLEARVRERTAELQDANDRLTREVAERERVELERSRLLEREREARGRAEEADRAKDRLLAMLSHELRTPLNPILLATAALIDDQTTPRDLLPTLEMIRRNTLLEARFIDDLLDYTRASKGKLALECRVVDLHAIVREALETCRADLDDAGVRVAVDLRAARHHVRGDDARLQQILWNLLKNAAKFSPRGEAVVVRSRDESPAGPGADPAVVVEVADEGIGIDADAIERIFAPFEQGRGDGRRSVGLGLGLAIGRSMAEAHGGTLTARSEGPGRGATFTLRLPTAAEPVPRPDPAPASPTAVARPRSILLIEDDPSSLAVLARLLRQDGHDVVEANCGAAALDLIAKRPVDLIISDLGLPDTSGSDLLASLRAVRAVPAVALTGYGSPEDVRAARAAGFDAHLTKPIVLATLLDVIRGFSVVDRPAVDE